MTSQKSGELLHELFESAADRWPKRTSILCGASQLTYRELEERANQLAHFLRARNIGCDDRVAILLPRSEHVYVAMLAVLKAGAAYVPFDPDIPLERARFILQDCGAKYLITFSHLTRNLGEVTSLLCLDANQNEITSLSSDRLVRAETGVASENLCYMIYTSGTTGQPKGVQIEHRNVTSLVRAESQLYGIRPDDKVFQLASVAFDASVEEIWMAFFHGAALIVGTPEIIYPGPEFSETLTRLGVTVLSGVPTFLSMLDRDIPTVRLLILGGEVCPPEVAARWFRPDRTVFNTYGPTETTVISTAALLTPGQAVTIGRAIANTQVFLLGEDGRPVPPGSPGEICIGGEGLSRGYLNRPELQKEKFITAEALTEKPLRLYRTGDSARMTPEGNLEYLGRLDDQVKVRGFRIELSEIEAVLVQCPGVLAAATAVHQATQRIAAYIIPRADRKPNRIAMRRTLLQRLPAYMVPAFLDELQALPMTNSGKIDRKKLPEPRLPLTDEKGTPLAPRTEVERSVAGVWRSVLKLDSLSVQDDFFLDLGGHSLLAAVAVSQLRRLGGFERISIADLYAHPTVEALAKFAQTPDDRPAPKTQFPFYNASKLSYAFCAAGQALGIVFLSGIYAWQWLGAYLAYGYMVVADRPIDQALLVALLVLCGITPVTLLFSIGLKWLFLGRLRPGRYPLWGWFYWRFWFVRSVVRAVPVQYLDGTPLLNLYYRLMGARIGRDVFIGTHTLTTFDLLTVGDGSSIGPNSSIDGSSVTGGMLEIAPVTIRQRCYIGTLCALGANTVMEDGAGLDDLSMLPDGEHIPAGELWRGSPASFAGRLETEPERPPWRVTSWLYHIAGIILFPIVIVIAVMPGLMLITHLGHQDEGYTFLMDAPLIAIPFVVFLAAQLLLCKWVVIRRIRPGRYPVGGFSYARIWFFDQLMNMSTDVMEAFYETLYAAPWLRAMGARIGARCEIAVVKLVQPDLLEMGEECMIADQVLVGAQSVRSGWLSIGEVKLGRRVFSGNDAVVPSGTIIEDNALIGLKSLPPKLDNGPVPKNTSWLGSPPMALPKRYHSNQFSESQTFHPPKRIYALRLSIELIRIFLPATIFVILASLMIDTTDVLQDHIGFRSWLLVLPFLYAAAGIVSVLAMVVIKWVVIGRYREGERPLWSSFVWRNDLVNGVYFNLGEHFFLGILLGTPFIAWALRIFGMKIGHRCYIDSVSFTEFDLIKIGNDVAVNDKANIQTHLFEDRIMKIGSIRIGDKCSVGARATVLYGAHMENGACLGDLSLLMKGETLPAGTRWQGIPARNIALTPQSVENLPELGRKEL